MDTLKLLKEKRMLKIVPLILWIAISLCAYSGIFVSLMIKTMDNRIDWDQSKKT